METGKVIKDIYDISFDPDDVSQEDRCPMREWHNKLINKTYFQLDIFDVTRMIIQKMYLELAVAKAVSFVKETPFCGLRYEGELLELLYKVDVCYLEKYKEILKEILDNALRQNEVYEWLCEEERVEFSDLVKCFAQKLLID
ncbi:MAG: contact-dependent growth inhibition system immunity protein [Ruminococcus flavefaciens]|nr:contact-dependent growth inhibition system immunity protein [Ruminococcus flavefaciens]